MSDATTSSSGVAGDGGAAGAEGPVAADVQGDAVSAGASSGAAGAQQPVKGAGVPAAPRVPSPMRAIEQAGSAQEGARAARSIPPEQLAAASRGDRRSLLAFLRMRRGV